jgi:hypothetical protein
VGFVEKQVDALDQHSCGGCDFRTPHFQSWVCRQQGCPFFNCCE